MRSCMLSVEIGSGCNFAFLQLEFPSWQCPPIMAFGDMVRIHQQITT